MHRIDEALVRKNLLRLASIGRDESGAVNRVFGSDFINEEREETIRYFEECGMTTSVDAAGNVHGYYRPAGPMADEILLGSHLDSVKAGGMFDGTAGLVAAAECVRLLAENISDLSGRICTEENVSVFKSLIRRLSSNI